MRLLFLVLFFILTINVSYSQEPKILNYDKDSKTLKVEVEGKEYNLEIPVDPTNIATEEVHGSESGGVEKKRKHYARGPLSGEVSPRLYNIPTDNLLKKGGFGFDFTHRFSGDIDRDTANEVYGLDSFSYTGIGLYYGITDFLEAHGFRSSLTDASEFGLKLRLFREAKKISEGFPFGLTLAGGFQNDNIQNSIDFYLQPVISKVLVPRWAKVYVAPTWSDKSATIGMANSLSAVFFPFLDPKGRDYKRSSGTFAVPIGATLQIVPDRLSLFGEYVPVVSGYKEAENGWSFGLQILSRLETHVWTIGISNVPYSTFGQYVVGGPNNDWHLGFNISARIR